MLVSPGMRVCLQIIFSDMTNEISTCSEHGLNSTVGWTCRPGLSGWEKDGGPNSKQGQASELLVSKNIFRYTINHDTYLGGYFTNQQHGKIPFAGIKSVQELQ